VEFWHVWNYGERQAGITRLVDDFNRENPYGITVRLASYEDLDEAFHTAIQKGELPNAVLSYPNILAGWYENDSVIDLGPFLKDPVVGFSTSARNDFFPGVLDYGRTPGGNYIAISISQSINTLYFNTTWARELGFDRQPLTTSELEKMACAAAEANLKDDRTGNDGTGGLVLYPGATNIMSWLYAYGENGLGPDLESYRFSTSPTRSAAGFLLDLWESGCAFETDSYPNDEFATRRALFTMRSSADIAYQKAAFQKDRAYNDDWELIPFPGPDGEQAVAGLGQTVSIVNSTREKELATWLFLKHLLSPAVQAAWVETSGYYPVRESALEYLDDYQADNPQWASGVKLLTYTHNEPVLPSWGTVRWAIYDAFQGILYDSSRSIILQLKELDITAAEIAAEND
jgi:multiple sugar transport system substrate-binding protein